MSRFAGLFMRKNAKWALAARTVAALVAALGVTLAASPATAKSSGQSSNVATLDAPPTGIAPPGDVLRAGHLGREIGEIQSIIHFYSDLIGFGLVGERTAAKPFMVSKPLAEFAELGEDDDAYESVSRVALLPIPGTSSTPGGPEMTIEAIEIKGIKSRPYNPPLTDPGASYLTILVSDLDKTLAVLKSERAPVITPGGNPVELASWPGITGKIRSVFVKDPDGYPVQLMEITPAPNSTAAPGAKVLGARVTIVVDDLQASARIYQGLVGPDFKFWMSPAMNDKSYAAATGTPGKFKVAMALVPGSPVVMELIEHDNHNRKFTKAYIQDPGTAHFLFMAKDDDLIMPRVHSLELHTLSKSNAPVYLSPTVRSFFVPDPQGFWLEFMDRDVKRNPDAK